MKTVRIKPDSFKNMLWKVPTIFFGYTLGDLVYAPCYRRCIWTEFQWCCVCFTSEAKHQSMPNPQDTLGTSLFLLTLSFVAACIQIAYKSCMPLWQVIARHRVLEYPRVMLRKDIWHFSTSMATERAEGLAGSCKSPAVLQLSHGDTVGDSVFLLKFPKGSSGPALGASPQSRQFRSEVFQHRK